MFLGYATRMTRRNRVWLAVALCVAASIATPLAQRPAREACEIITPVRPVPGVREASSLALSRRFPRRLFTLNDSPQQPDLIVLGLDGVVRGRVRLQNAAITDWEDLTAGPCPGGTCLYVGDIGDNTRRRRTISVYRLLEPKDGDTHAVAERFDATFPDGPHDAEAMFLGPNGRLYLLTKDARGPRLYAWPGALTRARAQLEFVAALAIKGDKGRFSRITDAEQSLDGKTVALRTNDTLYLVPAAELILGDLTHAREMSLKRLNEPQGEGVALGQNGDVFLAGEGGSRSLDGSFAQLRCQ